MRFTLRLGMAYLPIEDYGLIGNMQTAALVGRNGSVDWLCLPRFDSASCFTALLGQEEHGRWLIAPVGELRGVTRRYRAGTLILETDFETADGAARVGVVHQHVSGQRRPSGRRLVGDESIDQAVVGPGDPRAALLEPGPLQERCGGALDDLALDEREEGW